MRKERVFLKYRVDVSLIRRNIIDSLRSEEYVPRIRLLKASDNSEGRRLSAARRAEESYEFPIINRKIQRLQNDVIIERLCDAAEPDKLIFFHLPVLLAKILSYLLKQLMKQKLVPK